MSDVDHNDDGIDKAFEGFGEDPAPVTPPKDPATPPAQPGAAAEPPKADPPKPAEEPKKDEQPGTPQDPNKKEEPETPPTDPAKKPEEGAKPPETPETPPAPEEPKPLTKDDLTSIIRNVQLEERNSGVALENTTKEVLEAYYPEGLSNVLIDQKSGKELRTPQDVVEVTNGKMSAEQAAQWLMNEQFKLDQSVAKIKEDAKTVAETTINFKRDSMAVLQKYEPLFKQYPHLQGKAFNLMMKQVKADEQKGVILQAPDVMELYDTYLEPYQQAYEYANKQSATNPVPPANPAAPPATPGAEDRLDESGDGGGSPVDDPNDFAQQVGKELAKGI